MLISEEDIRLVEASLETARKAGADKARATLSRSEEDLVATLNGETDRVTHCADSSLSLALFADGRFGTFSTNRLEKDSLRDFIRTSVGIVKSISPDPCRDLPDPERCCTQARSGDELGLTDPCRDSLKPEERMRRAEAASAFNTGVILSEEGEYSDSIYDTVLMDTNGVFCRHCETSFDYGVEITVEQAGEKYSGYWWDSSSRLSALDGNCAPKALKRALDRRGAEAVKGGKYNLVIDTEVASKVVSPVLRALNAYSIQQNSSFLVGSLGKRLFPERLTIMDVPHIVGQTCSKLFDSEGVATVETPVIKDGVVCEYFVNSYMSRKLGIAPTIEDATRPKVMPDAAEMTQDGILKLCGSGILVTDFNGGNSNPVTGDFSYGVEGFYFENGLIIKPVSEMLVTGNLLELWGRLIAVGNDARSCMSKLIPTLAFENVDFSG